MKFCDNIDLRVNLLVSPEYVLDFQSRDKDKAVFLVFHVFSRCKRLVNSTILRNTVDN